MELIQISKDTLINPEKISSMQYVTMDGVRSCILMIDGVQYLVEFPLGEVYAKLIRAGMKANDQFFAG